MSANLAISNGAEHGSCSTCTLSEFCQPLGLDPGDHDRLQELVGVRRKLHRGDRLFHCGDGFTSVYSVRRGFLKSTLVCPDGREQVTGFFMTGELLGLDGIGSGRHTSTASALEDTEVCVIAFSRLEELARELPSFQHHLHRVMSREIVRDQGVMLLLGSMSGEERLAAFLLNLSTRLSRRGFSASEFILRTTREEIGSYLGMKLETVSRLFSRFQEDGLIEVRQKHVRIRDIDGLRGMVGAQEA